MDVRRFNRNLCWGYPSSGHDTIVPDENVFIVEEGIGSAFMVSFSDELVVKL